MIILWTSGIKYFVSRNLNWGQTNVASWSFFVQDLALFIFTIEGYDEPEILSDEIVNSALKVLTLDGINFYLKRAKRGRNHI